MVVEFDVGKTTQTLTSVRRAPALEAAKRSSTPQSALSALGFDRKEGTLTENEAGNDPSSNIAPLTQAELGELYKQAYVQGLIKFDRPLDFSAFIKSEGKTQHSLLLPNGKNIRAQVGVRLPRPCCSKKLCSVEYCKEGYWIVVEGKNKDGVVATSHILLSDNKYIVGKKAILGVYTKEQRDLRTLYAKAHEEGVVTLDPPFDFSAFISSQGTTQQGILLPNGKSIGTMLGAGLSNPCRFPKLCSIEYCKEGYWVVVEAKDKNGVSVISHILLSDSKDNVGKDAILGVYTMEERKLRALYTKAYKEGIVTLDPSLDISAFISGKGQTQESLLLPNGKSIGATLGVGLPKNCSSPKLCSIKYSPQDKGYWLRLSAVSDGSVKEVEVLLSEAPSVTGKDAILQKVDDQSDLLPEKFNVAVKQGVRAARRHLSVSVHEKQVHRRQITSIKGECFEQVVGVLLSSLHTDTKVIPQYCLCVDDTRGYYGVRADFRVGDNIVEVKWGGAAANIEETYHKHQRYLDPRHSYELVTMTHNAEVSVPTTLFSSMVEKSVLCRELNDTLARVTSLVTEITLTSSAAECDEVLQRLKVIQEYLYSAVKEQNAKSGEERIAGLRKALTLLLETPDGELRRSLSAHTPHRWSTLEAYWEYEGTLRRNLISLSQIAAEQPERYELGYSFLGWNEDDTWSVLTFTSKKDRDMRLLLDMVQDQSGYLATSDREKILTISGEKNEQGWFINPTFHIGDRISFTSSATVDDVQKVTSPQELCDLIQRSGLTLTHEDLTFCEAYAAMHREG